MAIAALIMTVQRRRRSAPIFFPLLIHRGPPQIGGRVSDVKIAAIVAVSAARRVRSSSAEPTP
jgi:hypothetical protein